MEAGAPSCDCCRLSTQQIPSVVAVSAKQFEPPIVAEELPSPVELLEQAPISVPFVGKSESCSAFSPPKLYLLHETYLI